MQFTENVYNEALVSIEGICLAIAKKGLVHLEMCAPNLSVNIAYHRYLQYETHFDVNDLRTFTETNLPKLVLKQRIVYHTIVQAITNQSGGLYIIYVPGGTSKTVLILLVLAII